MTAARRLLRWAWLGSIALALLLTSPTASANADGTVEDDSPPPAASLAQAQTRFAAADWAAVARLTAPIARDATVPRADRAEAWRLYGLSLYFLGRAPEAERALLELLRLDPDAHLDPALVAPDALVFFEDVRSRHAGELRAYKPRPPRRRYAALNFLPPLGQFQNEEPVKGWVIGVSAAALLATNITTYFVLRDSCGDFQVCDVGADRADTLRQVNLASGALFLGVLTYGVVDGLLGYRRLSVTPTPDGLQMAWVFD